MILAWDPVTKAERDLVCLDTDLARFRAELRRLAEKESFNAMHRLKCAQVAQLLRANIDWLEGVRAELVAEIEGAT